jgi:hypothetical protein
VRRRCLRQLVEHHGKTHRRRRREARAGGGTIRSRFRARCGALRQSVVSAARSSVNPSSISDSTAIRAVEPRKLVMEQGGLGLVSGCRAKRARIAGKRRGEAAAR